MSDSNKSWIPHFSEFCLRLLKLSIWEKIPDRCLEKPLKLIQAICKKSGQVPDKIPHKLSFFWAIFELCFSSEPNLSFYFHSILIIFQSVSQTFVCLKKVSDKYAKSESSLKYALKNCVSNFGSHIWSIQYQEKAYMNTIFIKL